MAQGNGAAAIGEIAAPDWHMLRMMNIVNDYAQMRMRMSTSERHELERVRADAYRDMGLDPNKQYVRSAKTGEVYEKTDVPKDATELTADRAHQPKI